MPKKRANKKPLTAKKSSIAKKSSVAKKSSTAKKSAVAKKPPTSELKGWTQIAAFLSIPVSTAHRWARDGMPVRREARKILANADELRAWLGRESHMSAPAQILTDESDVANALKQSIAAMKKP
jgi:hypothetical protein